MAISPDTVVAERSSLGKMGTGTRRRLPVPIFLKRQLWFKGKARTDEIAEHTSYGM